MISSIAFVLYLGKLVSWLYNLYVSKKKVDHSIDNTYERKNICRKTANATFYEMITYALVAIIAYILGK